MGIQSYAKDLKPSKRGELEITDLNKMYLQDDSLYVEKMNRGYAWLDTGTHNSLLEASQFISTIENRQGLKIGCIEEIAYRKGWIGLDQLTSSIEKYKNSEYALTLEKTLQTKF